MAKGDNRQVNYNGGNYRAGKYDLGYSKPSQKRLPKKGKWEKGFEKTRGFWQQNS